MPLALEARFHVRVIILERVSHNGEWQPPVSSVKRKAHRLCMLPPTTNSSLLPTVRRHVEKLLDRIDRSCVEREKYLAYQK